MDNFEEFKAYAKEEFNLDVGKSKEDGVGFEDIFEELSDYFKLNKPLDNDNNK